MAIQSDIRSTPYIEGTTPLITYAVQDENGAAIAGASLTTMVATIISRTTGSAITGWSATDINGAQGNAVSSLGVGTWVLPLTATVKTATGVHEDFDFVITFTYGSSRVGKHIIVTRCEETRV